MNCILGGRGGGGVGKDRTKLRKYSYCPIFYLGKYKRKKYLFLILRGFKNKCTFLVLITYCKEEIIFTKDLSVYSNCCFLSEDSPKSAESRIEIRTQSILYTCTYTCRQEGMLTTQLYASPNLKVPKCENFHRADSFYFFTIKPLWVGDFRAKIKN